MILGAEAIEALLPWRHPFRLVDQVLECTPHQRIVTRKLVTAADPVVGGAGAEGPCLPGVMLLEGMGQSAALLFRLSYDEAAAGRLLLLGYLRASVHGSAGPGERITFEVRSEKMTRRGGVFDAAARRGPAILAEAELAFSSAAGEA